MTEYFERDGKRGIRTTVEVMLDDVDFPFPIPPINTDPNPPTGSGKIDYTVINGVVKIPALQQGDNRVIYDNDFIFDTPCHILSWLMAHKGQLNLVGNIMTANADTVVWYFKRTIAHWTSAYKLVTAAKLKKVPAPVEGASKPLVKPGSGKIEDTVKENSVGAQLIIAEAKKCTPEKPLLVLTGGQATTVANAYLLDPSIADKIIILHTAGYYDGGHDSYNTMDHWSAYICIKRMKYVCANIKGKENDKYWFTGKNLGLTSALVNSLPASPVTTAFKEWYTKFFAIEGMGDATPLLWYLKNSVWKNIVRKKEDGQVVTSDDYDFLFVTENDWAQYGPVLITKLKELLSGEPPVVIPPDEEIPPVVTPPIGGISSGFEEAIRTASPGKTIVFNKGTYTLPNLNIPVGVNVDLGGSVINGSTPGAFNDQNAVFKIENGRDQTIKNGTINGRNICSGGVMLTNCDRVHIDGVNASDMKFFGLWVRNSKNGSIKNARLHNTSGAVGAWASGECCFSDITDYEIAFIETTSDSKIRGYGFKALYPGGTLTNVKFHHLKTRMNHDSVWNNGQSRNIGFEVEGTKMVNVEVYECDFGNQISLASGKADGGTVIVRDNLFDVAGDTYGVETILNNLQLLNNTFRRAGCMIANFHPNGVWGNWIIRGNKFLQPAGSAMWGSIFYMNTQGGKNILIENNEIEKFASMPLINNKTGITERNNIVRTV